MSYYPKKQWDRMIPKIKDGSIILIAKPGEWFDEGTKVEYIGAYMDSYEKDGTYSPSGLFCGQRNGKLDEEMCSFDEFELTVDGMIVAYSLESEVKEVLEKINNDENNRS